MNEKNMGKWALKFVVCLVVPFLVAFLLPLVLGIPEYLPLFMVANIFIAIFLQKKYVGTQPR